MHKKFLLTYTLLGLLLFSFLPAGQAGKFEDAVLDEFSKGCPRMFCSIKFHKGKSYEQVTNVKQETGESTYGNQTVKHYTYVKEYKYPSLPDVYQCSKCERIYDDKPRGCYDGFIQFAGANPEYDLKNRTRLVLARTGGYKLPCSKLGGSSKDDPFDIVCHQYYGRKGNGWCNTMSELWETAVIMDEYVAKSGREFFYLMDRSSEVDPEMKREVVMEGSGCVVL